MSKNQKYLIVALVIVVLVVGGYFAFKTFRKRKTLTDDNGGGTADLPGLTVDGGGGGSVKPPQATNPTTKTLPQVALLIRNRIDGPTIPLSDQKEVYELIRKVKVEDRFRLLSLYNLTYEPDFFAAVSTKFSPAEKARIYSLVPKK
jgi:hypothetical protein